MALHYDSLLSLPLAHRNSKLYGQERRELETEKHNYYKNPLQTRPPNDSALNISNPLPPKMIELLNELAMVDKEIHRLENQIKELKSEAEHEKQVQIHPTLQESPLIDSCKMGNEKVNLDQMKGLHFITKAIKGDYKMSDFGLNDKALNTKRYNELPLRDDQPRHLTPKKDRGVDPPSNLEEEIIQKWPPNKLSENIMRCLIFIFLRLLRLSRAMEPDKTIARATDFSVSFRAETIINAKSGLVFPKESRQQDPYGIFESKESLVRDIGAYKNLVRFTSTSMDLKCIQNSGSVPLFHRLKMLMDGLEKVDLSFLSHRQKIAFWINMYNACIMHGYLQYGIASISSPEKMLALISQATLNIAGNSINAQTIERFILRKPPNSQQKQILDTKEMRFHHLYGLKTSDPNIVFALCCGTRSSPAVKVYTAEGVTAELERSKLEYLQAAIVVASTKRIVIPELLLQNMFDFGKDLKSLLEWLCHQLPPSGSLRKSIVDCFRRVDGGGCKASAVVEMIPYDFEFQYLFAV